MSNVYNLTDELTNWVLRINTLCNAKDDEIAKLQKELAETRAAWATVVKDRDADILSKMQEIEKLKAERAGDQQRLLHYEAEIARLSAAPCAGASSSAAE